MIVSKEKLINTLSDFITDDLMQDVKDGALKMMALAITKMAKKSPEMIDKFLDNAIVSSLLCEEDGEYNLDTALNILRETVNETGKIYLTIPSIPLIYPEGSRLGITPSDVNKLINRLSQ